MKQSISTQTKITLLLLSLLTMMSNVAIVTALPHLSIEYKNIPHIELIARLMLTLPSLVVAMFAPFAGRYIYALGLKKSATIALILFAVAGSSGVFIINIYGLLFSRVLFGMAVSILMIVSTSLVGNLFQAELREKFMAMQMAFTALGGMGFVFAGGILSDIHYSYVFAIYLVGFGVLAMVSFYIPQDKPKTETKKLIITLNPKIFKVYLLGFFVMVLFFILPTQFPFLLINHFHASGKLTSLVISSAFIANALGALSFRLLRRKFTYPFIYLIGLSVMSIGMMMIGNISNVYLFFISSPMIGFSAGLLMTTISVWMLSLTDETNRIKSSSYLTTALFLGQFVSPIVTYPLVLKFGVQPFFTMMGISIIIMVILSFFVIKLKNRNLFFH